MLDRVLGRLLRVRGVSMTPSIPDGALVWMSPWPQMVRSPRRHELVVARRPESAELDVKRVVGLPMERVAWLGAALRIDDMPLSEPYASHPMAVPGDDLQSAQLGPDEFFLAGDNRLYSVDSRRYGPVPRRAILGTVVWVNRPGRRA
jgi:signal peptidase I